MTKPIAHCLIREGPTYRRNAFVVGLQRCGFDVRFQIPLTFNPGDVLVIWNKYWQFEQLADKFEAAGNAVIVAENGYIGVDGDGIQNYALALHGHNGSGRWPDGDGSRFRALNIEPAPWRTSGKHIAIRGQRGIGSKLMASPHEWHKKTHLAVMQKTGRAIYTIEHPGNGAVSNQQHNAYLRDAHALIIWSSSVGVKALCMGVPVFYDAPHWVCESAARKGFDNIEQPLMDDGLRLRALERMAHSQYFVAEIATGEPIMRLLELHKGK